MGHARNLTQKQRYENLLDKYNSNVVTTEMIKRELSENKELVVQKECKIDQLLKEMAAMRMGVSDLTGTIGVLNGQVAWLNGHVGDLVERLDNAVEDRVPHIDIPPNQRETIVILRDIHDNNLPYYVMRCQRRNITSLIRKKRTEGFNLEIVHEIDYFPNAIKLWTAFRRRHRANFNMDHNWFGLVNMTERQMIEAIESIVAERREV